MFCDSDSGITPVDDITVGINCAAFCFHNYYYYYYYYYFLQLSFHSVAVVFTLVQTKQIRICIRKQNNTKTQYTQYKTVNTSTRITKTPTQLSKHPHITKPTHTHTHTF